MEISFARNVRAAGFMTAAMALFVFNDACIKLVAEDMSISQILALRGFLVALLFSGLIYLQGEPGNWRMLLDRWVIMRALLEVGVAFSFLNAVARMPLANASTLLFLAPLFLTVMAALVLGETVRLRRWIAVIVGFIGMLLVASPSGDGWNWVVLLPILAAFFIALRDVVTRKISSQISSATISLVTAIAISLAGLISLPNELVSFTTAHLAWIVLSSFFILGAYQFYVIATRTGELSFLSPFKYASIPLSVAIGWTFWNETPGISVFAGALIIIGSGLFIWWRERQLSLRSTPVVTEAAAQRVSRGVNPLPEPGARPE
ncbi:MAG: DMT family transporter [Geminicoccaceae bacterium]